MYESDACMHVLVYVLMLMLILVLMSMLVLMNMMKKRCEDDVYGLMLMLIHMC